VDDEIEACDNIISILSEFIKSNISIVGVAHDTNEAESLINKFNPDAVFLDIEMPGENAFQFLERIHPHKFEIIFITAYDEFAIKAFKQNAIDYIMKPVNIEEFTEAVSKLRDKLLYKYFVGNNEQQRLVLKQIANKERSSKIVFKTLNHIEVVDLGDIYSLEGRGNYCCVSFNKLGVIKEVITSYSLSFYEDLLSADFYRVHKSHIINCRHVYDVQSNDNYCVILANKAEIPISRRRYSGLINFLKQNNFYSA
jgi:two-component system LytT family response regulator